MLLSSPAVTHWSMPPPWPPWRRRELPLYLYYNLPTSTLWWFYPFLSLSLSLDPNLHEYYASCKAGEIIILKCYGRIKLSLVCIGAWLGSRIYINVSALRLMRCSDVWFSRARLLHLANIPSALLPLLASCRFIQRIDSGCGSWAAMYRYSNMEKDRSVVGCMESPTNRYFCTASNGKKQ